MMRCTCTSCVSTWGGSNPLKPRALRSSRLNAVPLLSRGSRSRSRPLGEVVPGAARGVVIGGLLAIRKGGASVFILMPTVIAAQFRVRARLDLHQDRPALGL